MNNLIQSLLQRAIDAFEVSDFNLAESTSKSILKIDKRNLVALSILGLIKALQKNYADAISYLNKAAQLNPNDATL